MATPSGLSAKDERPAGTTVLFSLPVVSLRIVFTYLAPPSSPSHLLSVFLSLQWAESLEVLPLPVLEPFERPSSCISAVSNPMNQHQ